MLKRVYGRKFKRDINQRQALFKGLMRSLALNESIKTTEAKAKSIKGHFEKLVTHAKDGEISRYHLVKHVSEDAVDRLIGDIAPRMKDRPGGYTRIIRLENRLKDNAKMVVLELVEKGEKVADVSSKKKKTTKSAVAKRSSETGKSAVKAVMTKEAPMPKMTGLKRLVSRQKKGQ